MPGRPGLAVFDWMNETDNCKIYTNSRKISRHICISYQNISNNKWKKNFKAYAVPNRKVVESLLQRIKMKRSKNCCVYDYVFSHFVMWKQKVKNRKVSGIQGEFIT